MRADKKTLKVWLVDPSLFTAPYDAALTAGLVASGAAPLWITRPTRQADRQELPLDMTDTFFYRLVDRASWIPGRARSAAKGLAHAFGLLRLVVKVWTHRPDVVHIQWLVVPPLDVLAIMLIKPVCPVVLTVHDTVPFNGEKLSPLQRFGHSAPPRLADRVIVHTHAGWCRMVDQGLPARSVSIIPHGPLSLDTPSLHTPLKPEARDARWTFVLFGEIKPYKGVDVMIDAVAALPEDVRRKMRVIVAGRPRMDVAPLLQRIDELGVAAQFDMRLERLSENEMAALFDEADCFAFPYRQIDASGVYFLVKPLGKWLVASRVGVFAEDIVDGRDGKLVPPRNVMALAGALQHAVESRPSTDVITPADSWARIGATTRKVYDSVIFDRCIAGPREPRSVAW